MATNKKWHKFGLNNKFTGGATLKMLTERGPHLNSDSTRDC